MIDAALLNQLFQYCYSLTSDRCNAYDLLQSALEKFLKQPRQENIKHLPYIRRIIRNHFIDQCRREKVIEFYNFEELGPADIDTRNLEQLIVDQNEIDSIWQLLTIPEREILYLWALEGFTAAEIADELAVPRGTVLAKIHRIRKKISQSSVTDQRGVL